MEGDLCLEVEDDWNADRSLEPQASASVMHDGRRRNSWVKRRSGQAGVKRRQKKVLERDTGARLGSVNSFF